jgi:hypothetical protein
MPAKLNWRRASARARTDPNHARSDTLFSTDDHLVEPPHMFEGRLPAKLSGRRVVETEEGHEVWSFDGQIYLLRVNF